jgi:hypothetical protein
VTGLAALNPYRGMRERHVNGPVGLEQGFDVTTRPGGAVGPLVFVIRAAGDLRVRDGAVGPVVFSGHGSSLRSGGIAAADARGRVWRR